MSDRAHVRSQYPLMAELVGLVLAGVLAVALLVTAVAAVVGAAPVLAVLVIGLVMVLWVLAGLLLATHFGGHGHAARTQSHGRTGASLTVTAADGTPLNVEVDGPGEAEVTVVFAHGWVCELGAWRHQRAFLAERGVRAVYYDQRGHGHSGWRSMAPDGIGVRELADDLAAVIAATVPTGRIVLVGHSMGGMTAMALAQRHPELLAERVGGVLLLGTCAGPLGESLTLGLPRALTAAHRLVRRHAVSTITLLGLMPRAMARLLGIGPYYFFGSLLAVGNRSPWARQATARGLWATPLHIAGHTLRSVLAHDERAALGGFDPARTVVVSGLADRLVPYADQVELARLIGEARHVSLPRVGHMVAQEAPDVVNAELARLVAGAGPA